MIKARHNGPYKVTGPITLIDADGNEYYAPRRRPSGRALPLRRLSHEALLRQQPQAQIGFDACERADFER